MNTLTEAGLDAVKEDLKSWSVANKVVNKAAFNEWLNTWVEAAQGFYDADPSAPPISGWIHQRRTRKLAHGVH